MIAFDRSIGLHASICVVPQVRPISPSKAASRKSRKKDAGLCKKYQKQLTERENIRTTNCQIRPILTYRQGRFWVWHIGHKQTHRLQADLHTVYLYDFIADYFSPVSAFVITPSILHVLPSTRIYA